MPKLVVKGKAAPYIFMFFVFPAPSVNLLAVFRNTDALISVCFDRYIDKSLLVGWLVVLGLTALSDSISIYIGPSPKESEKEKRKDRGE